MKHLVVDARHALPTNDGLGTYVRQIVPHICAAGERAGAFRTTLLVSPAVEWFWRAAAPGARLLPSTVRPTGIGQNWQIHKQIAPLQPDLFFYPSLDPPLLVRTPLVFTIHDVTPFQMRPYFERLDRAKLSYLRVVTTAGLRRARAVLAVSQTTRREIGNVFGARVLPKVHVTPNGMCPPPVTERDSKVPLDCLLYVGTDRPHKNLQRVIEAYALARRQVPELPRLEIVGGIRTPDQLKQALRQFGLEDSVVLRGHVSEVELEATYARTLGLVFPSLAEGFGLPILEAMVRSVPVITSNISGCAEVAGDAALTVNPFEVGEIAAAMVRLFRESDLRADLVRKGHQRASEFTWERTVAQTLDVINACLAASR